LPDPPRYVARTSAGPAGFSFRTVASVNPPPNGPNNYGTGDGIVHTRDAAVEALGESGDRRALPVLLEVLANPKPMDVSYGAIPREEPVGERAALNALGYLGQAASGAAPQVVRYLKHEDARIAEAAATALGAIGTAQTVPALIAALGRNGIAWQAAAALGRFGPAAKSALPALARLIEEAPDRDGGMRIRQAIADIGGRGAADALPKPYSMMMSEIWRIAREAANSRGVRLGAVHLNDPKEVIEVKRRDGGRIVIAFSREAWTGRRVAEGTVTVERDGAPPGTEPYRGIDHLERVLVRAVAPAVVR
jgi:hypothetical protein